MFKPVSKDKLINDRCKAYEYLFNNEEMKEEEIIEGNKLIAEFMEYKIAIGTKDEYSTPFAVTKWEETGAFSYNHNEYEYVVEKDHRIDEMLFHSSWDWLMPVVEKIEKTIAYVNIKGCLVTISDMVDVSKPTKIEAIYQACIEIIEWHNNQKK